MPTCLSKLQFQKLLAGLKSPNAKIAKLYPGEGQDLQPIHTVYGGAQLFKLNTCQKIGDLAYHHFETYLASAFDLQECFNLPDYVLAKTVHSRVRERLQHQAVEDFRIDFEDGYGHRPDNEEDDSAEFAAREVARGMRENTLSPGIGIRIKTLSEELKHRAIRTLDLFVTTLVKEAKGELPPRFVITLPKITSVGQVKVFVQTLEAIEKANKLKPGTLRLEFMVEVPQSILDPTGRAVLPEFLTAAKGRCVAAHFGTYDYTASVNITAEHQTMDHPACDFAKEVMKVSLAGTGIWLSDGATNIMPVGPHKDPKSDHEKKENREAIFQAWRTSYSHIRHSLKNGFYQGWDLHPGQLPVRYVALYIFFLQSLGPASTRLKNFIEKAAQATLVGDVFDDAATGQGLLNYFLRALNCGAISEAQILETGLTSEDIRLRSFKKILDVRTR